MWVYRDHLRCQKCGIRGYPFYAYRYRNKERPHLWNKVYVVGVCILCKKEDNTRIGRRFYYKNRKKLLLKNKVWEQNHRKYRLKYRKKRRNTVVFWNKGKKKYE